MYLKLELVRGITTEVRTSIEEKEVIKCTLDGVQERKVKIRERWYRTVTTYNEKGMKKTRKEIGVLVVFKRKGKRKNLSIKGKRKKKV